MAREPNLLLDALIERSGMSRASLAARINRRRPDLALAYDHASVARWIRDHAMARPPVPELICQILGERLGVELTTADIGMQPGATDGGSLALTSAVDRAAALWRGDHRGQTLVATGCGGQRIEPVWEWENPPDDLDVARSGQRRVDPVEVARLRRLRATYEEMYRRVGGVPTRPRIVAVLNDQVAPLLRSAYDDQLGRALFRAAGSLSALAGVCAYDADDQALARAHLFTSLRLAKASGDRGFGGYVVAVLATQALHLDDCRLVVQYAQTALRAAGSHLSPALVTDLHALISKAYARMGDRATCRAHLRQSEQTAARIDRAGEPAEVSYVMPGLLETQAAEALRRLGDLAGALPYAEASVDTANDAHLRGQVHRYAGLALILAATSPRIDIERAAHLGGLMLDRAEGMESARIRDRISGVTAALRRHRHTTAAAAYLERVDEQQERTA